MFRVDKIVFKLRNITAISSLLPWGIFTWSQKEKNQTYMRVSMISAPIIENIDSTPWWWTIAKQWRVEMFIIWWSSDTTDTELLDIADVIDSEIASSSCNKIYDRDWFKVEKVVQSGAIWPLYDNNFKRPVLKKDYLFTYYE